MMPLRGIAKQNIVMLRSNNHRLLDVMFRTPPFGGGCETVIDILFHVAAERQHETKCRDVERPFGGTLNNHRRFALMFVFVIRDF
jgi:hypothetical protein